MIKKAPFSAVECAIGLGLALLCQTTFADDLPVADAVAKATGSSVSQQSQPIDPTKEPTSDEVSGASIRSFPLPLDGMSLVEAKDKKTYIVSTNGRYQFEGKIRNVYTNKLIETVDDAIAERYMTLADMSLSLADIATIAYGNPNLPLQGRLMVDPYCAECKRVLSELEKIKDRVHLEIMITPIAGKESIVTGLNMWCAYEKNYNLGRQILGDLMKGPPYQQYPQNPDCKGQRLMLNTMLTRTLDVKGVPAFWRADGFAKAGVPKDILAFLKSRRTKELAEAQGGGK